MPLPPRPIVQIAPRARILIASQAPGARAFQSGVAFDDPSGRRLRAWIGVSEAEFYGSGRFAVAPMGFCFPGQDARGGDLPPMKRCAAVWRDGLLARLADIKVILLVGLAAQKWHLGPGVKSLTETVRAWRKAPALGDARVFPTPHPSWRNTSWLKRNPWFENETLPVLRAAVRSHL